MLENLVKRGANLYDPENVKELIAQQDTWIHCHTLRHWKATMKHARTRDILHVKQLLGHKRIENTLKHTQLVIFSSDEHVCKVAKTLREATQVIQAGFEYVTDMDGCKIFRKRK